MMGVVPWWRPAHLEYHGCDGGSYEDGHKKHDQGPKDPLFTAYPVCKYELFSLLSDPPIIA